MRRPCFLYEYDERMYKYKNLVQIAFNILILHFLQFPRSAFNNKRPPDDNKRRKSFYRETHFYHKHIIGPVQHIITSIMWLHIVDKPISKVYFLLG